MWLVGGNETTWVALRVRYAFTHPKGSSANGDCTHITLYYLIHHIKPRAYGVSLGFRKFCFTRSPKWSFWSHGAALLLSGTFREQHTPPPLPPPHFLPFLLWTLTVIQIRNQEMKAASQRFWQSGHQWIKWWIRFLFILKITCTEACLRWVQGFAYLPRVLVLISGSTHPDH